MDITLQSEEEEEHADHPPFALSASLVLVGLLENIHIMWDTLLG